ncbi:hypothetical protein Bbelb_278360 [Branchiostoma belcheri]|nr:hypothetical protein Bbelb_278360 [Branchiostoma belcheri]
MAEAMDVCVDWVDAYSDGEVQAFEPYQFEPEAMEKKRRRQRHQIANLHSTPKDLLGDYPMAGIRTDLNWCDTLLKLLRVIASGSTREEYYTRLNELQESDIWKSNVKLQTWISIHWLPKAELSTTGPETAAWNNELLTSLVRRQLAASADGQTITCRTAVHGHPLQDISTMPQTASPTLSKDVEQPFHVHMYIMHPYRRRDGNVLQYAP